MNITLDVKDGATPHIDVVKRQLPFAIKEALNATALDFQKAQRERLHDIFTLRRVQFAERAIKIKPFATKARQEVRIAVDAPGGRSDIFGKFETDRTKQPVSGQHIAVPVDPSRTNRVSVGRLAGGASVSVGGIIRAKDRPRRVIESGRGFIRKVGGRTAIFERLGSRTAKKLGKALRLLYILVPHVRITPELEFVRTAEKTVEKRWAINFAAAFERAIRTAR